MNVSVSEVPPPKALINRPRYAYLVRVPLH